MNSTEQWTKHFALELVACDSEQEVTAILDSDQAICNLIWEPFGDSDTNFATIYNQQQNSIAALAEKPINSIDAVLLKECLLKGIDPRGADAPATMLDAVGQFFGVKRGDFSELSDQKRRKLADNIWIIAKGSRQRPTIAVADRGEGQHPHDFKKTFLSLHKGNKADIPFVQGKYNMGGTGVLRFCGEMGYHLILSRREPGLLKSGQEDQWGVTLVRLHRVEDSRHRHGWWEYCTDQSSHILTFPGEPLPILPEGSSLHAGTYIQLFDYDLENPSIITLELWRDLNRLLYQPALPISMYEGRGYGGKTQSKILLGNAVRLHLDERDKVEARLTDFFCKLGRLGERRIDVTVLKVETSKSEYTTQNNAVFFTINGQTHGTLGRSFLKTKGNFPYLADHLVVTIDCSDVTTDVRDRIFMASRDRMAQNEISREIEDKLAEALRGHEGLGRLEQARRLAMVSRNPSDKQFLEEVVAKLVKDNPSLASLLGLTGRIVDPTTPGTVELPEFKGKWFPTFLKIANYNDRGGRIYTKQIPVNSFAVIKLETDASNDYLTRYVDPGQLAIAGRVEVESYYLHNGLVTLAISPLPSTVVGQEEDISVRLTRPYDEPLEATIRIHFVEPRKPGGHGGDGPPKPPKGRDFHLPDPTLVYKEKREGSPSWIQMSPPWTGADVAEVKSYNGNVGLDGADVFINMDSASLHNFLLTKKLGTKRRELATRHYQTAIYLYSLVLHNQLRDHAERDDLVPRVIKGVAKTVMELWQAKEWEANPDGD